MQPTALNVCEIVINHLSVFALLAILRIIISTVIDVDINVKVVLL
jgi:hypothetical protein